MGCVKVSFFETKEAPFFKLFSNVSSQKTQVATCNYSFLFSFCFEVFVSCLVVYIGYEQLLLP